MATYNGEKYLKEQLDSILFQIGIDDEVIISDDGSTDGTINIILSYNDNRIKLIHNKIQQKFTTKSNQVAKNFENALKNATGDYILLSDQDDIWEKTKVQHLFTLFKEENFNLIVHDATLINKNNAIIINSYFKTLHSKSGFIKNIIKNSYLGCCMAFDKNVLIKSLPFPKNIIAHDIWIGLIAERIGNVTFIDNKLTRYRRHDSNLTASGSKSPNSLFFKLKYRIHFILMFYFRITSCHKSKIELS